MRGLARGHGDGFGCARRLLRAGRQRCRRRSLRPCRAVGHDGPDGALRRTTREAQRAGHPSRRLGRALGFERRAPVRRARCGWQASAPRRKCCAAAIRMSRMSSGSAGSAMTSSPRAGGRPPALRPLARWRVVRHRCRRGHGGSGRRHSQRHPWLRVRSRRPRPARSAGRHRSPFERSRSGSVRRRVRHRDLRSVSAGRCIFTSEEMVYAGPRDPIRGHLQSARRLTGCPANLRQQDSPTLGDPPARRGPAGRGLERLAPGRHAPGLPALRDLTARRMALRRRHADAKVARVETPAGVETAAKAARGVVAAATQQAGQDVRPTPVPAPRPLVPLDERPHDPAA